MHACIHNTYLNYFETLLQFKRDALYASVASKEMLSHDWHFMMVALVEFDPFKTEKDRCFYANEPCVGFCYKSRNLLISWAITLWICHPPVAGMKMFLLWQDVLLFCWDIPCTKVNSHFQSFSDKFRLFCQCSFSCLLLTVEVLASKF